MMRRIFLLFLLLSILAGCAGSSGPSPAEATLTKVGQMAPDFSLATLDSSTFTLSEQKGKVVLINWFATWCPPCQEEMPHLQKDVWEVFQGEEFTMVSVAREETAEKVGPFVEKYAVTWPFALDTDRSAFARYAQAFIPRNTVVDRQGKIIYQGNGFEKPEFAEMIEVIKKELSR